MWTTLALSTASLLLTSTAVAAEKHILYADDVLIKPFASIVDSTSPLVVTSIGRRQDDSANTDGPTQDEVPIVNADGSLNITAWNQVTDQACRDALRPLTRSSNPSGHSVCYNLPTLDAARGSFEADLRVYHVSQPRDEWTNIDSRNIDVGVSFTGADVRDVQEEDIQGMGMLGDVGAGDGTVVNAKRQNTPNPNQQQDGDSEPRLMQAYKLIGQVRPEEMTSPLSMGTLEALVMPALTFTANQNNGQNPLSTTVTANEASFLTGVFSDQVVLSDISAAQNAVDRQSERLAAGEIAFVVPGTQLMILPIGLIVTGAWAVIGIGAYGYGTVQRIKYREMYKSRQSVQTKKPSRW